jgi:5-methylcytosine-specific restriction endonuclease McrA
LEDKVYVFKRERGHCFYCDVLVQPGSGGPHWDTEATLDHIIPVSQGGENSTENAVLSCYHCNYERGNLSAEYYLQYKRKLQRNYVLTSRQNHVII